MTAHVTFCRTIDGDDAAPTDLSRRAEDEVACDEEVICKCGNGPVVCCRGEHGESPHAAYGTRDRILTVWTADPEACRRCGGPNPSWSAPSPLWNKIMRSNDILGDPLFADLVCVPCFITLASEAGVAGRWTVTVDPLPTDLIYTTPSGRVWDGDKCLWVDGDAS